MRPLPQEREAESFGSYAVGRNHPLRNLLTLRPSAQAASESSFKEDAQEGKFGFDAL